jgi:hypothetical protein
MQLSTWDMFHALSNTHMGNLPRYRTSSCDILVSRVFFKQKYLRCISCLKYRTSPILKWKFGRQEDGYIKFQSPAKVTGTETDIRHCVLLRYNATFSILFINFSLSNTLFWCCVLYISFLLFRVSQEIWYTSWGYSSKIWDIYLTGGPWTGQQGKVWRFTSYTTYLRSA